MFAANFFDGRFYVATIITHDLLPVTSTRNRIPEHPHKWKEIKINSVSGKIQEIGRFLYWTGIVVFGLEYEEA